MQIGASLADPDNGFADFCEDFGTKVGVAFQTQDDYLDIMGDYKLLHKNILGDVCDHQPTFFTNYVFTHGSDAEKDYLNQVFGKEMNDEQRSKVKKIFIGSCAIAEGQKLIAENYNQAKTLLGKADLGKEYKQKLSELISLVENRQS
jgi:geranylgeranyl pyrophosphate synthase